MPFKDCKIWEGKIYSNGYGSKWSKFSKCARNAHRVIYEEKYGEIPKGMVVMHICDNRACVNINHLKLGTQSDNIRDMHSKKRWCDRKGERHPLHKLTNEIILAIKDLFFIDGLKQAEIAKIFDVHQCNVSRIVNNKRWYYGSI